VSKKYILLIPEHFKKKYKKKYNKQRVKREYYKKCRGKGLIVGVERKFFNKEG
jgi:hypothetical protein